MKKKRIITALLGIAMSLPMAAQYYGNGKPTPPRYYESGQNYNRYNSNGSGIYYGLRLGMGLATVNSDQTYWDGPSSRTGINVGGVMGIQLAPTVPAFLELGLYCTEKGGRQNDKGNGKIQFNLTYLEMPIVAKYSIDMDGDLAIQPYVGGYVAMGVGGKIKRYAEKTVEGAFSDDYFKRFDGGLRIGCGIEYQMLYADIAYDFGLANIGRDYFSSTHNGCLYLNIGVNF